MSQAIHFRHAYHKHQTVAGAFTFNVTVDPLEGRVTDDGIFAVEMALEKFLPGDATMSSWTIWRTMVHKRSGTLTVIEPDAKRGPHNDVADPLDMHGSSTTVASFVVFSKVDDNTIGITIDTTGMVPSPTIEIGMWVDIKATRY